DVTIAPVLAFLGANYAHQPSHACALFFDLYRQGLSIQLKRIKQNIIHLDDQSYAIQLEYLSMTNSRNPRIIPILGCSVPMCPLDTFIQLYEAKLTDDMTKECQSNRIKRKK